MTTNTIKIATAAETILALDLGKYKSVACICRRAEDPRFTTITTSRAELIRMLAKHRPAVVLIEACLLCGWVRDLCTELGVPCMVANTTSEAWKFKHLKRKTDRDDALGAMLSRPHNDIPMTPHACGPRKHAEPR